jgi:hypothetical protein
MVPESWLANDACCQVEEGNETAEGNPKQKEAVS